MLLRTSSSVTWTEHKVFFWLYLQMSQAHPWHLGTYVAFMHSRHPGVQYNKTTIKEQVNTNTHPQWILAQPLSLGSIARFSCTGRQTQTSYIRTYVYTVHKSCKTDNLYMNLCSNILDSIYGSKDDHGCKNPKDRYVICCSQKNWVLYP